MKIFLAVLSAVIAGLICGLVIHFVLKPKAPHEYITLTEIAAYAESLAEYPTSDDNNWADPRFLKYYKTRLPLWQSNFFKAFGYKHQSAWSPKFLSSQLKKLTAREQALNVQATKILHLKAHNPSSVFIFGDVHGAFHSMVRNIAYLKSLGIISEELKMIDKNAYLVFNGNYIDKSPYNIDSLILLSILLEQNPEQVIYIAGKHERNGYWENVGLGRELANRGKPYSSQEIPFRNQIRDFFKTLPEALYLSGQNDNSDAIRIAFNERKDLSFDEKNIDPALFEHKEILKVITLNSEASIPQVDVRVSFQSEDWQKSNRIKNGLGYLDQDYGASAWAVLSSPTTIHKEFLGFYDDAFVKLDLSKSLSSASLSLFHQDTRLLTGYIKDPPINPLTGSKITPNNEGGNFKFLSLASTMALERGAPTIGQMAKRSLNVAVKHFNNDDNNPIKIRLYVENDNYVPNLARRNVAGFLNDNIKYLILPVGSPTILSYIDSLDKNDFAILYPLTGSLPIRNKKYTNLALFRASLDDEAKVLIKTVYKDFAALKFALFYQDDGVGTHGPFEAALKELEAVGITNTAIITYTRGSTNFDNQVQEFIKAQPDALGFFSTAKSAQEFIRQAGTTVLGNTKMFGVSFIGEATIKRFIKRLGVEILFGAVVPNPHLSQLDIVKEYRKAMDEINSDYDVYSLEAYISSKILLKAINNTDEPIIPRKIMKQMESFKEYDFHGIKLDFNPDTRCISKHMWLETGADEDWPRYSLATKEAD
jgi:branched-chain amino acid transport system substrate-binding protein